jgi:uncharacterized protein YndB with AHSA1/START domain
MSAQPPVSARVTRRFNASPEDVFDAWLDAGKVRQWFAPGLAELGLRTMGLNDAEADRRLAEGNQLSSIDKRRGEPRCLNPSSVERVLAQW